MRVAEPVPSVDERTLQHHSAATRDLLPNGGACRRSQVQAGKIRLKGEVLISGWWYQGAALQHR